MVGDVLQEEISITYPSRDSLASKDSSYERFPGKNIRKNRLKEIEILKITTRDAQKWLKDVRIHIRKQSDGISPHARAE